MAIFALLFIVLPLVEIYVAVQVSHVVGVLGTLGLLLVLSLSGIWLTKFAGFGVIARIRSQLAAGRMPGNEVIDGGLVLVGGMLLIVPGFITAVAGLFLLFPPSRKLARDGFKRRYLPRVTYIGPGTNPATNPDAGRIDPPEIIDI